MAGGLVGGFAAAVANLAGVGKANWPAGGLGVGLAVGAAIGPVTGVAGGLTGGAIGGFAAGLGTSVGAGPLSAAVNGLGVGLASAVALTLSCQREPVSAPEWQPVGAVAGLAIGASVGLATSLTAGPLLGLLVAIPTGVAIGWAAGLADVGGESSGPPTPTGSVAHDARAFAKYWAAGIASGGVIGLLADGLDTVRAKETSAALTSVAANGIVLGLLVAFVAGIVLGGLHSAWLAFTITRVWLALRGHLPWRLMPFLADARKRGILRQLGPVYQFRHVELQERLAGQYDHR